MFAGISMFSVSDGMLQVMEQTMTFWPIAPSTFLDPPLTFVMMHSWFQGKQKRICLHLTLTVTLTFDLES